MFKRSLVLVLLLASPAWGAVQRVWTGQGSDVSVLACGADDSLNASSCTTIACQTGTATPGTCTVGECFFDTDETAGVNLYLCTATDTWTLSGTALDHGVLSGLTDDDHTQYLLLAGRSGGQTANGGTASGNNLVLDANSAATNGEIGLNSLVALFDDYPDVSSGLPGTDTNDAFRFDPAIDVSGTLTTIKVLDLSPDIDTGQAAGTVMSIRLVDTSGSWDVNDATAAVDGAVALLRSDFTTTSTVAGADPALITLIVDSTVSTYNAATTTANPTTRNASYAATQQFKATNTGTYDHDGGYVGYEFEPRLNASSGATMDMASVTGLLVKDLASSGAGTNILREYAAIDIEPLDNTNITKGIGIRNPSATVLTPDTTTTVTATSTIPHDRSLEEIDSAGVVTITSTPIISDGEPGECLKVMNVNASSSITLSHGTSANLSLCGAANFTVRAGTGVELCWSDSNSNWNQICGSS